MKLKTTIGIVLLASLGLSFGSWCVKLTWTKLSSCLRRYTKMIRLSLSIRCCTRLLMKLTSTDSYWRFVGWD